MKQIDYFSEKDKSWNCKQDNDCIIQPILKIDQLMFDQHWQVLMVPLHIFVMEHLSVRKLPVSEQKHHNRGEEED